MKRLGRKNENEDSYVVIKTNICNLHVSYSSSMLLLTAAGKTIFWTPLKGAPLGMGGGGEAQNAWVTLGFVVISASMFRISQLPDGEGVILICLWTL